MKKISIRHETKVEALRVKINMKIRAREEALNGILWDYCLKNNGGLKIRFP